MYLSAQLLLFVSSILLFFRFLNFWLNWNYHLTSNWTFVIGIRQHFFLSFYLLAFFHTLYYSLSREVFFFSDLTLFFSIFFLDSPSVFNIRFSFKLASRFLLIYWTLFSFTLPFSDCLFELAISFCFYTIPIFLISFSRFFQVFIFELILDLFSVCLCRFEHIFCSVLLSPFWSFFYSFCGIRTFISLKCFTHILLKFTPFDIFYMQIAY